MEPTITRNKRKALGKKPNSPKKEAQPFSYEIPDGQESIQLLAKINITRGNHQVVSATRVVTLHR